VFLSKLSGTNCAIFFEDTITDPVYIVRNYTVVNKQYLQKKKKPILAILIENNCLKQECR
jgi:hypothetical protein